MKTKTTQTFGVMQVLVKTKTIQILGVMQILAWLAFIGYAAEAGGLLISFGVSCVNPEASKNLYKGLDLYELRQFSFFYYALSVSSMVALSIMKSYIWFQVIKILSKMNLMNPFRIEVTHTLERISYVLFGTWIATLFINVLTSWIMKESEVLQGNLNTMDEFLFMAGLVYIISQVFKRGVEIQSENELTV
jgi:hypothetical protein